MAPAPNIFWLTASNCPQQAGPLGFCASCLQFALTHAVTWQSIPPWDATAPTLRPLQEPLQLEDDGTPVSFTQFELEHNDKSVWGFRFDGPISLQRGSSSVLFAPLLPSGCRKRKIQSDRLRVDRRFHLPACSVEADDHA